jgi:hypothetical protein
MNELMNERRAWGKGTKQSSNAALDKLPIVTSQRSSTELQVHQWKDPVATNPRSCTKPKPCPSHSAWSTRSACRCQHRHGAVNMHHLLQSVQQRILEKQATRSPRSVLRLQRTRSGVVKVKWVRLNPFGTAQIVYYNRLASVCRLPPEARLMHI